jgi:hypothetical protein
MADAGAHAPAPVYLSSERFMNEYVQIRAGRPVGEFLLSVFFFLERNLSRKPAREGKAGGRWRKGR